MSDEVSPAFLDASVREFLEAVSSREPTPGGGAVAAVTAASAAALVAMVAALTEAREERREHWPHAAKIRRSADGICHVLQEAALEDAASFREYLAALRLPRDTDEQRSARRAARQAASRRATEAPLGVARDARRVLEMAAELAPLAHSQVVSDVAAAAQLARAAVAAALVMVRVNLPSRPSGSDEPFYATVRASMAEIESQLDRRTDDVQKHVQNMIQN